MRAAKALRLNIAIARDVTSHASPQQGVTLGNERSRADLVIKFKLIKLSNSPVSVIKLIDFIQSLES